MKKLMIVLVLVALGSLIAGDALARDCVRLRTQDQTCEPDCTGDGPNNDDCPQIQQCDRDRDRDQDGQPVPEDGLMTRLQNMIQNMFRWCEL
ncbi:MAG: hypothetical protein HQ567_27385 [Candidatus Nealsonbacteria bacterium]|nr:hypothetical protein [Candidatus Nealsonbacteria bacterium]